MDTESITLVELQMALDACLAASPAQGEDLHFEASRLADLYGPMLFKNQNSVLIASLELDLQAVLKKWRRAVAATPKAEG